MSIVFLVAYLCAFAINMCGIAIFAFLLYYAVALMQEKNRDFKHKLFCVITITWCILTLIKLLRVLLSIHTLVNGVLSQVR